MDSSRWTITISSFPSPTDTVKFRPILLVAFLTAALALGYGTSRPPPAATSRSGLQDWRLPADFPPLPPRPVELPRDHDDHPQAPLETWQLYGVLTTPSRQKIAFQLHLLAIGLTPDPPPRKSPWAARRYFLGYFTRTEAAPAKFHVSERGERAVLGLAGTADGRLWLDDWWLQLRGDRIRLRAGVPGRYLTLTLRGEEAPSITETSAAFRHYRLPLLEASGKWASETVHGFAWLEHGWGQLPLTGGAAQSQRFTIRLHDGRELTCVDVRISSEEPGSAQCRLDRRALNRVRITVRDRWRDDRGTRYPVAWCLRSDDLNLEIRAVVPDQKLPGPVPLWSGWVVAEGEGDVKGEGFVQSFGFLED